MTFEYNFDPNNADQIQEAYEYTRDNLFGAGREACLEWFLKHGAVNEAQSESESDSDDNRDDSKKYDKWNGYMKTDRYGIPINPD